MRWGVEKRLKFIEFRLFWEGGINRADIVDQFGVSVPQASKDLTLYEEKAPGNLIYDKSAKRYPSLTFDEAIVKNLKVMDATALALCRDQNMLLKVFSIFVPGALKRVVLGGDEGTFVHC